MTLLSSLFTKTQETIESPAILESSVAKLISKIIVDADLTDDALVKISRQLDFWYISEKLPDVELVALAEKLIKDTMVSSSNDTTFKCPTMRFGKTELQIPIVTTGGMRIQSTWMPDFVPLVTPSSTKILKSESQSTLKTVIRRCMKLGLNHFETARMYGTSEFQFAVALREMMDAGEFKREDFIFQTKIFVAPKKDFLKRWKETWDHVGDRLGYIDLFSVHCCSSPDKYDILFDNGDDSLIHILKEFRNEGKFKHFGFSTHGVGTTILKMINTEEFDYVNLHYHHFGSYHAEGTLHPNGGQGNGPNVKRALELDMGMFNISPVDKGGMLQKPSKGIARAIGPKLTPIAFSLLTAWENGHHTATVGFGRPTDLDESVSTAALYGSDSKEETYREVAAAKERLTNVAKAKLGEEWYEKGLLNIPSCYEKVTDGIAIGHILWLHNLVSAYGMYDFAKMRYDSLVGTRSSVWKPNKLTYEDNIKNVPDGNPGLSYDSTVDLSMALGNHYDPKLALQKVIECHSWLGGGAGGKKMTEEERISRGWEAAYDLQTWMIFPGPDELLSAKNVVLQNVTNGCFGAIVDTGPNSKKFKNIAGQTRAAYTSLEM